MYEKLKKSDNAIMIDTPGSPDPLKIVESTDSLSETET